MDRILRIASRKGGDIASWKAAFSQLPTAAGRSRLLEKTKLASGPSIAEFVDDLVGAQPELRGTHTVCKAFSAFVHMWRLAIAGGQKGPRLLVTGHEELKVEDLPEVAGHSVVQVEAGKATPLLGSLIDPLLTFTPALRAVGAEIREAARRTFAKLQSNGFGLPMQARAWVTRVEAAVLPGTETLVSCKIGFRAVMHQLDVAQLDAARILLGARENLLLDEGLQLWAETRMGSRLGTRWATRTIMARARVTLMPANSPVGKSLRGAELGGGKCWVRDVDALAAHLGVTESVRDVLEPGEVGRQLRAEERRLVVARFRRRFVAPRAKQYDEQWYREALANLPDRVQLPYRDLVLGGDEGPPPVWGIDLGWAGWGRQDWKYFRAWVITRITLGIPLMIWGAGDVPAFIPECPCCGAPKVNIPHLIGACAGTANHWQPRPGSGRIQWSWEEILQATASMTEIRMKVRILGRCCATLVDGLRRRRRNSKD